MKYTGERFIPNFDGPEIEAEHVHRYKVISDALRGLHVLDAGCGTGYGSLILAQSAASVSGIDISQETIEWSQEHYGFQDNLTFSQASLDALPFQDETFDCIVCLEVIEHVDGDIQLAFLSEAKRVLKLEGFMIMSTPNKLIYTDRSGYTNPYHVKEFYYDEFKSYLRTKFDAIKIFNQSLYSVSTMLSENDTNTRVPLYKNNTVDPVGKYMVAVCASEQSRIEEVDLSSVYEYDNPAGVAVATLYAATEAKLYSPQFRQSRAFAFHGENQFSITFDISEHRSATSFRFDPIEHQFCICSIQETLTDGTIDSVLPLNALEYHRTGFVFLNTDPQFELSGDFSNATYLTLKGYFKTMSHTEISQFVTAYYHRVLDENKSEIINEQLSRLVDDVKGYIAEQNEIAHNNQSVLIDKHTSKVWNLQREYMEQALDKHAKELHRTNEMLMNDRTRMNDIMEKCHAQDLALKNIEEMIRKKWSFSKMIKSILRWDKK